MKIIPQKGSGTFLLKVHDTDENCTVSNFAIVTIDEQLKNQIETFKKNIEDLKAAGHSIYRMTDFNCAVDYFSECEYCDYEQISDELREQLENVMEQHDGSIEIAPVEIPDDVPMIREEGSQLIVDDFGVIFDAYVKHTNTRMYTEKIAHYEIK